MNLLSFDAKQIKDVLKAQFVKHEWSYSDVAKKLNVSLPTFKRWMTSSTIPLEAVLEILKAMSLSLSDLEDLVGKSGHISKYISNSHEDFIVNHPAEAYIFLLLYIGYDFGEISTHLNLQAIQLDAMLFKLDRNKFIKFHSRTSLQCLIKPPFKWNESSKFSKKYFLTTVDVLMKRILHQGGGFHTEFAENKPFLRIGEIFLTKASYSQFKAESHQMVQKYKDRASTEIRTHQTPSLYPVAFLQFVDHFSIWKTVMWDQNSKSTK